MRILVLGCGRLGLRAGAVLAGWGHQVHGVRRRSEAVHPLPMTAGDAADPATWDALGPDWAAVLLTATPGVRRGRDHGVDRIAAQVAVRLPGARLVYTGSTAVYGEADGQPVAEDGPLAADAGPLLAVEQAVLAVADALVLRLPALVGLGRDRAVERARSAAADGRLRIPGDPDRPFSIIHEDDAALVAAEAVAGQLADERGVLNAAAPTAPIAREYYAGAMRLAGLDLPIAGDGSPKPSRRIDATRLWTRLPGLAWRGPWDP